MWLSALNVFFRDVQHFTEIFLMAWFWMTPVIYPIGNMLSTLPTWAQKIYLCNPMVHIILLYQYIVYNSAENAPGAEGAPSAVYLNPWAIVGVVVFSIFLVITGYIYFTRREGKFAEFI